MHFVTLDDDDDHEPFPASNRLSSTSNNHMIHDQIRLGLVSQQHNNPRSYSIGSSYSNGSQKSTKCWIFLAGGVSTVAVFAVGVAIFLLTLNSNANGSNSGPKPSVVQQLSAQPLGPTSIDVQWSCAMNQTIDAFQLEMIPRVLANATNHWNASTTVNMLDNGLSCQTVVTQLNSSTAYCFRIRAQSKLHGDSPYTNAQCNSTATASIPEIPNAPTAIDFSANTTFDRLHVVAAPKYNTRDHKQMAHTMQLYINAKHIKNVTIDKRTSVADAKLELDHAQRGHLILLTSSACNDQGCSPLSDSIRCVVALRGKHGKPTALCSSCEVGPGGGTESSTLAPPTHPTANSGPSTTSALVVWNWGEGGGSGTCGSSKPTGFQVQRSDAWTKKTVLNGPLINISSSGSDVLRGGSSGSSGGNRGVARWGGEGELSNNGAMFTIKIDGLLPAMAYNIRMRAYTIRTNGNMLYSRWSEVFVVKMKEAGECGNSGDVLVQRDHFTTMVPDIQSCMLKCIVSGKECVDECVVQKIGLSAKCAACWGQEGTCVEAHCAVLCLKDSKGEPCLQCTNENCMPAMEQCTGLPRYTFPNP